MNFTEPAAVPHFLLDNPCRPAKNTANSGKNRWPLGRASDLAPEEVHHHDVIHFALDELQQDLSDSRREEVVRRLREHVRRIKQRRASSG